MVQMSMSAVSSSNGNTTEAGATSTKTLSDFATLLSCALVAADQGNFQLLGNAGGQLSSKMTPQACCSIPSLRLQQGASSTTKDDGPKTKPVLEQAAANNLGSPCTLPCSEMGTAPMTILWNLNQSFLYLVQSRLKSTIQALAKQRGAGDNARSRMVLELLQPSATPISLNTIVSSFRTLPISNENNNDHADVCVQPLILDVVVDLKVLGQIVSVQLGAPGTMQGCLDGSLIALAAVTLDTKTLLRCMMQETRRLVRRAVSLATQIAACMTQTLPRNAPGGLVKLRRQLLQGHSSTGLPPSVLMAAAVQQDETRRRAETQTTIQKAPSFKLPAPIDSTKALEECFTMPPPPARLPRAPSGSSVQKIPKLDSSSSSSSSLSSSVNESRKRERHEPEDGTSNSQHKVLRKD